MSIKITRGGVDKAPDWERIAEGMPAALVAVMWNVLEDVIENRDSTVILQMFAALATRWNGMTPDERARAADEGEGWYFTAEAFERDHEERKEAQSIVQRERAAGKLIIPGNGSSH